MVGNDQIKLVNVFLSFTLFFDSHVIIVHIYRVQCDILMQVCHMSFSDLDN
jgi:hypothetical protein